MSPYEVLCLAGAAGLGWYLADALVKIASGTFLYVVSKVEQRWFDYRNPEDAALNKRIVEANKAQQRKQAEAFVSSTEEPTKQVPELGGYH